MKKFVIASDIHGSEMNDAACESLHAFVGEFKPHIRVIAGDLWDFAAIRKGADEEERGQSMACDFACGQSFANKFFSGGDENHLMLGNHDVRIWDLLESRDGVKRDLAQKMINDVHALAKKNGADIIPYDSRDGVLAIGDLKVVHGYHTGASACAAHSRIYGNVVFGHIHSIESFQTPGLKQQEARSIGCLCNLNPHYASRKTGKLRWANGWAYGWVFEDGTYQIHQARSINGRFHASTELRSF